MSVFRVHFVRAQFAIAFLSECLFVDFGGYTVIW